jgi:hypothetical protein
MERSARKIDEFAGSFTANRFLADRFIADRFSAAFKDYE